MPPIGGALRAAAAIAALAGLSFAAALPAAAQTTITNRIVTFGDSLSDNGNAFALVGAQPTGPYPSGRFTNDRVFVEYLAQSGSLAISGAQTLVGGAPLAPGNVDFAFGGSRTDTLATPFPGIQTQINGYLAAGGTFGATDVVTLWGGANNLFQGIPVAAATPATAQTVLAGIATAAAGNEAAQVQQLATAGARTIVVINLPDFSRLPAFAGAASQLAGSGSGTFNTALAAGLAPVAAANPNVNIVTIDAAKAFNAVLANPAAFGITNTTTPCLLTGVCTNALFYDGVHPTAIGHRIVAAVVYNNLLIGTQIPGVQSLADIGFENRRNAVVSGFEQLDQIRQTNGTIRYFLQGIGDRIERDTTGSRLGFDSTSGGVRFGGIASYNESWRLGAAFSAVTGSGRSGSITFEPTHIAIDALAGFTQGAYFVNAGIGAGFLTFGDYKRQLVGLPWQNTARPTGYTFSAAAEAGLHHQLGAIELTPLVRIAYLRATVDSFDEAGNAATVGFGRRTADGVTGAVELRASTQVTATAKVSAMIGYEDLLTGSGGLLRGRLIDSTAQPILLSTKGPVGQGLLFGVGAEAQLTPMLTLTAAYRGSALNDQTQHYGHLGLTAKF